MVLGAYVAFVLVVGVTAIVSAWLRVRALRSRSVVQTLATIVGQNLPLCESLRAAELAVETCFWPLLEVENGSWHLNYRPRRKLPVAEWLKTEGRFQHLFREEHQEVLEAFQEEVDRRWERLLVLCGE